MNWNTFAENINKVILAAIKNGGDSGGPYFSCPSKLEHEMKELLYITADFADYYTVKDVYINEFLTEIPQFTKI